MIGTCKMQKRIGKVFVVLFFFLAQLPHFSFLFFVLDGRSVLPTFQSLVHRPLIPPCQKNIRICPFESFRSLRFEERETRKMPHTLTGVCPFWSWPKKAFPLPSEQQHVWPGSKSQSKKAKLNRSSTKVFSLISPSVVSHGFDGNGQAEGGETFAGRERVFSSEVSLINNLKNCRKRERTVHCMLIGKK